MGLKPFNISLITLTFGIIIGIFIQNYLTINIWQSILFFIFSIIIGWIISKKIQKLIFFSVLQIGFSIGILLYAIHYQPNSSIHYTQKLEENKYYTFEGKLTSIKGKTCTISIEKADNQPIKGDVIIFFSDSLPNENIGNSILFHTKLTEISSPKNPYQFHFKEFAKHKNIFWQGFLSKQNYKITQNNQHLSAIILAEKIRQKIASSLEEYPFSTENQGVIKALLLGIRSDLLQETQQNYIDAGIIHILAISGLHIGIITMIFSYILSFFIRNKKYNWLKISILILIIWCYAFLTGLSASVVRAATMFSFLSFAIELKKRQGIYDNLVLSLFVLLLFNPFFVFDVGFQLSYFAVFSIVTFLPILRNIFHSKYKIIQKTWDLLSVSFSAQIGVLPISILYFHQFSGLFFISNLIILPVLGLILILGILILVLSVTKTLPLFLVSMYDSILTIINRIIEYISTFNILIFKEIYFNHELFFISLIAVIFLSLWFHFRKIQFLYGILICIIFGQISLLYNKFLLNNSELFIFHQPKKTLIAIRNSHHLSVFQEENTSKYISSFRENKIIKSIDYQQLRNILYFKNQKILCYDGSWNINENFPKIDYLVLKNSPKIHLEKLLKITSPKIVIADGSNFPKDISRWKLTCKQKNIPFHSTAEKGYFSEIIKN